MRIQLKNRNKCLSSELADLVNGRLSGLSDINVIGLSSFERATPESVVFIEDAKYLSKWNSTLSKVLLVQEDLQVELKKGSSIIRVKDIHNAVRLAMNFWKSTPTKCEGIHSTAVVHESAIIGNNVSIGSHVYIGPLAQISNNVIISNNVTVEEGVWIGESSFLSSGSVIHKGTVLGKRVQIGSNTVIGGEGFGYKFDSITKTLENIPHLGGVLIEDDVHVGSSSCIDRGKFEPTRIGKGTKIDNLVQIGHNAQIGQMSILCGCVGVAGSSSIGNNVQIGAGAGIGPHAIVGDGAMVAGKSGVTKKVDPGQRVFGMPARPYKRAIRELLLISRLPDLLKRVSSLEQILKSKSNNV